MGTYVKEFIESLEGHVTELGDVELVDLAEDSTAEWTQNESTKNGNLMDASLHKRYLGKKVSSKTIFTDENVSGLAYAKYSEDYGNEDSQSDNDNIVDVTAQQSLPKSDSEGESGTTYAREDMEEDICQQDDAEKVLVTISGDTQRSKAESVRKQLAIWDRLMQLHILSHAALRTFNQLPREQFAKQLQQSADDSTIANCRIVRKNLEQLNEIFGKMEETLLKSSKQTKGVLIQGDTNEVEDSDDEEIESSTDEEKHGFAKESNNEDTNVSPSCDSAIRNNEMNRKLQQQIRSKRRYSAAFMKKECAKHHERFVAFRSSTLSKWDERTTLSKIITMKNRKNDFSAFESVVLKQIEQVMSEKHRLLRRTQMKRHDIGRMGSAEDSNYDTEIFDDDDFYQQLLKELIDRKTASIVDPIEMSRQWLEIQKLRQKRSKMKKVDTKASKGRKIRYAVIPKLVNYFPSMPENAKWSQESRSQLFKSLFAP